MRPFFSPHFHAQNRKPQVFDESAFPDAPLRTKEYPRFNQIELNTDALVETSFSGLLTKRHSTHEFAGPLTKAELGSLLITSMQVRKEGGRSYPSGGAQYPIEIYVVVRAVEGVPSGLYHYNLVRKTLEELLLGDIEPEKFTTPVYTEQAKGAAATLLLTAVWNRSSEKYGEGAYQLALLEAGHLMQNILLTATALEIAARPMAGFNDAGVQELIDTEIDDESPVYMCFLGKEKSS